MSAETTQQQGRNLIRIMRGIGRTRNPETALSRAMRARRYDESPEFRLKSLLMPRLRSFLKNRFGDAVKPDESWIGCTWAELKQHIENQFKPGMAWDNHGEKGWHVDHHISLFWAKTPEQAKILSNYRNLRPVSNFQNLSKGVGQCPLFTSDPADPVLAEYMAAHD